ncbi:MAG: lipid-A-disaccharide synthase [Gammaproteobacteria bacterium]
MTVRPLRIVVIAGEVSGDRLGGALIRALRTRRADLVVSGMAGPDMLEAGCERLAHIDELSVMGISEVLRSFPRLRALRSRLVEHCLQIRPDAVVAIDVPDFNLGLELRLKRAGIRTVHWVCPQAWAWRSGRARKMSNAVDLLLALFPFEVEFFAQCGVRTEFVGHPLADSLPLHPDRLGARRALELAPEGTLIALMPGSRSQEIGRLLEPFVAAARILASGRSALRFVLCTAREDHASRARAACAGLPIDVFTGRSHQVLSAADVAIVASGTVTLEAMLCATPMVVGYRLAPLSYLIIRRLVRIPRIALPNILSGRPLVPELIQADMTPQALATAVLDWLGDPVRRAEYDATCREWHTLLRCDAAGRAADVILKMIEA